MCLFLVPYRVSDLLAKVKAMTISSRSDELEIGFPVAAQFDLNDIDFAFSVLMLALLYRKFSLSLCLGPA